MELRRSPPGDFALLLVSRMTSRVTPGKEILILGCVAYTAALSLESPILRKWLHPDRRKVKGKVSYPAKHCWI